MQSSRYKYRKWRKLDILSKPYFLEVCGAKNWLIDERHWLIHLLLVGLRALWLMWNLEETRFIDFIDSTEAPAKQLVSIWIHEVSQLSKTLFDNLSTDWIYYWECILNETIFFLWKMWEMTNQKYLLQFEKLRYLSHYNYFQSLIIIN